MSPEEHDYLAREARARVEIDKQLVAAGWVVQSQEALNLNAGPGVAVREFALEKGHGRVDYLLFLNGQPTGVIEAKHAAARPGRSGSTGDNTFTRRKWMQRHT